MKRWIHSKTDVVGYNIVGNYKIVINIDLSGAIQVVRASNQLDRYPGDQKFAQDAKTILENEYNFMIVPDTRGRLIDIHSSNWGISIYFNCIFDLANVNDFAELVKLSNCKWLAGQNVGIGCAVEFRISDYFLTAGRGADPNHYADNQTSKTLNDYQSVDYQVSGQYDVFIDKQELYKRYTDSLDQLRLEINTFIIKCSKAVNNARLEGQWNGELKLQ